MSQLEFPTLRGTHAMSDVTNRPATLILASVGAFVTSLDVVVVSTALPSLRTHLGASLSDLEWTINAYNLAFASLMLTAAALGDRFGRKRVYIRGLRGRAHRLAGGAGRRRRHRAAALAHPDQRGVPAGEAGHRDRHLGRYHRTGG